MRPSGRGLTGWQRQTAAGNRLASWRRPPARCGNRTWPRPAGRRTPTRRRARCTAERRARRRQPLLGARCGIQGPRTPPIWTACGFETPAVERRRRATLHREQPQQQPRCPTRQQPQRAQSNAATAAWCGCAGRRWDVSAEPCPSVGRRCGAPGAAGVRRRARGHVPVGCQWCGRYGHGKPVGADVCRCQASRTVTNQTTGQSQTMMTRGGTRRAHRLLNGFAPTGAEFCAPAPECGRAVR